MKIDILRPLNPPTNFQAESTQTNLRGVRREKCLPERFNFAAGKTGQKLTIAQSMLILCQKEQDSLPVFITVLCNEDGSESFLFA